MINTDHPLRPHLDAIKDFLQSLPEKQQVDTLNDVRREIHKVSPFKNEPVDCVLWIYSDDVQANDYNPNQVAPPEMRLLQRSIEADGYTQPIVAYPERADDREYTVIDGFHRNRVGKEYKPVRERVKGYLPLVALEKDISNRMASTIRHNRARGSHSVDLMVNIVSELVESGMSDEWICKNIGMDADEILRLKQISGLAALFKDKDFSKAWVKAPKELEFYK
jgi:ParB-like chromosome segregation protein Spo0J